MIESTSSIKPLRTSIKEFDSIHVRKETDSWKVHLCIHRIQTFTNVVHPVLAEIYKDKTFLQILTL